MAYTATRFSLNFWHYHPEQPVGNTVREDGVKWGFKKTLFQSSCKHGGNVVIKLCFGC